ncbi:peptidyl-prolyl cis-trans isomerase [Balneola vulgaris]|uniref:peptidyl-prolyl cis-trans isomerase n=1 Tax=Balneola vulgaris TaxID=287535 RepID=UPI00037CD14A|nr:peptidyl-prolyl cis-trans isomerase [Balneola vulgaris]
MRRLPVQVLLGLMIAFIACLDAPVPEGVQFAKVGNKVLTLEEAKARIPDAIYMQDSVSALNDYRESWIRKQLILEEVERLDLEELESVQQKLTRLKEEVLISSFQEAIVSTPELNVAVTIEEARNYYQANKEKFLLNDRYIRFRHVIAATQSDAENAKRDLMRGIDWETVANRYSIYPELAIKESNRFWPARSALSDFETLNRYLQIIGFSEISRIEEINGRYHFVQLLEERTEGEHPDLDWLTEQIQDWLIMEKKRIAYNTYIKNLYLAAQANNEIEIYNVLPEQIKTDTTSDSLNTN